MKYRYIICSTLDGMVRGTNDTDAAESYAESEDFFVVDAQEGKWMLPDGVAEDLGDVGAIVEEDEEDAY